MDELTESNERLLLHRKAVHRRMIRMARMEGRTATQTVANSGRVEDGIAVHRLGPTVVWVEDGIAFHNLRLQA